MADVQVAVSHSGMENLFPRQEARQRNVEVAYLASQKMQNKIEHLNVKLNGRSYVQE